MSPLRGLSLENELAFIHFYNPVTPSGLKSVLNLEPIDTSL